MFASTVLMVRPAAFFANPETAASNPFQVADLDLSPEETRKRVLGEFDGMVAMLREAGIEVIVVQDEAEPAKPDAIFPNNWFSTHPDGRLVLYPMLSPLRRLERSKAVFDALNDFDFWIDNQWLKFESEGRYLEGTGSLVLDHENKVAYAARSPRTDEGLVRAWCEVMDFRPVVFDTHDQIYHTNVVMGIGDGFVGIGLQNVPEAQHSLFEEPVVPLTKQQIASFAGNFLTLANETVVMSERGWKSLGPLQKEFGKVLTPKLNTIEALGGGSARCMMAEIFLPRR